eukprot:m.104546 g.104546  ORF g.104546 m.104546 type:complete len:72 (+) comp12640_c0_seq2:164-379(+)
MLQCLLPRPLLCFVTSIAIAHPQLLSHDTQAAVGDFMFDLLCVRFVRPKLISLRLKDTKKTDKTDQQGKAN